LRLVACPDCHTQYDVSNVHGDTVRCRCGTDIANRSLDPVDATIRRCGSCGAIVDPKAETCEYCTSAIVRDESALGLICPECYARNEETSRFCTACGVAFRPEPVPVDAPEHPCVTCGVPMPVRSVGGVQVNECAKCRGLWAPGDTFDLLVRRAIEAARDADPLARPAPRVASGNPASSRVEYRRCPVCESVMNRRNFRRTSGVVIDRCREHGTWLDADELEQIAGFVLSGGIERAKAAEATTMKVPEKKKTTATAEYHRWLAQSRPHRGERPLIRTLVGFLEDLLS
jgi:Zn-finger nucleic acid-binding protein